MGIVLGVVFYAAAALCAFGSFIAWSEIDEAAGLMDFYFAASSTAATVGLLFSGFVCFALSGINSRLEAIRVELANGNSQSSSQGRVEPPLTSPIAFKGDSASVGSWRERTAS